MLNLATVDLLVMEGVKAQKAIRPLVATCRGIRFRRVLMFAPELPVAVEHLITEYHPWSATYEEWNKFMVKELNSYIPDGHCLFIHNDGFVLNPDAWTNEFLEYDYVAAPWWYEDGINVGNGGFSLRSKKYLVVSTQFELDYYAPEDHRLIRENGHTMLARGVRFAPERLARRFSLEGNDKQGRIWSGQFGFHNENITNISEWESKVQL
jgi:hypothetical protein